MNKMKFYIKFLQLATVIVLFSIIPASICSSDNSKLSRGEQILNDNDIIEPHWQNLVQNAISTTIAAKIALPKSFGTPVKLVIDKYGLPDNIVKSKFQDYFSHKLGEKETVTDVIVYHYDNFGYVVDQHDLKKNIIFIFWSNDGIHKPQQNNAIKNHP